MTECKAEQTGKDGVCTLFIDLLNRRKVKSHHPHGELLFLPWKQVPGSQLSAGVRWAFIMKSSHQSPSSFLHKMRFGWKIFEWNIFFHLPKDSKFINGCLIIIMRRASPMWVAGCNSNWNIPPLGNIWVSQISNPAGCPMHWGELDSPAQNDSASVLKVGMWQMVPHTASPLSRWQPHTRGDSPTPGSPLSRWHNKGSNWMPVFVAVFSNFSLKGSYPT